jgi:hypothetical protein
MGTIESVALSQPSARRFRFTSQSDRIVSKSPGSAISIGLDLCGWLAGIGGIDIGCQYVDCDFHV